MSRGDEASAELAQGPYFARAEDLDESRAISSSNFARGDLSIAQYRRLQPGLGLTDPNPLVPMFMAVVTLQPLPAHAGWREGRPVDVPYLGAGSLACLDLRESWVSDVRDPFHTFHAFLPLSAFDEFTAEARGPKIEKLFCPNTVETRDETMVALARSLAPLFERPQEVTPLFSDHIFAAIVAHLALNYGQPQNVGCRSALEIKRQTLTKFQERQAIGFLLDNIRLNPSVADLASLCGLSRAHFASAFRQTTGMPPHQWLLTNRVKRAKEMLHRTAMPIKEIAIECGFADQAHLTRVFKRALGIAPSRWRRDRND